MFLHIILSILRDFQQNFLEFNTFQVLLFHLYLGKFENNLVICRKKK